MNREQPHLVESAPLRYLLSLPSGEAPEAGGWPVLCFLHGYDEAAPHEIHGALGKHGPLRTGSAPQATRDFVVVAPQLPAAGDVWHRHADEVQQIVRQVKALHRGDPRRTYLTGFSFGGNGVFDLALAVRDMWAALWAVDPTRVPHADPGLPVWLSFGEVARYRKPGFIRQLRLEPSPDDVHADRIYLDEGQDHVGSATRAYRDERIYHWLLARRRPNGMIADSV